MKKLFSLFLLIGFVVLSPCGFAWADNTDSGRKVTNSAGVAGTSYSFEAQSGGGIAGGCTMEQIGKNCTKPGAEKAVCIQVVPKKGETAQPSCAARICKEGYLLVLNSKGGSKGICRSVKQAENDCKKKLKCSGDQEPSPLIEVNPNDASRMQAYRDNQCFCADKNIVVYDCGGGTGNPPTDSKTYTNVDDVVVEKNTCTKPGATFVAWECGNQKLVPNDKFKITGKTTCVAQWSTNKYTVNFDCGNGASGSVPQQSVSYNENITLPGHNAGCTKEKSTFTGWKCDGKNVTGTFNITKDTTCIAQWEECPACQPGDGCTCELSVENNECKYKTTPKENYRISSDGGTATPRCEQVTACPTGADGTYPECECGNDKNYERSSNTCIPKCGDGASWDGEGCVCEDEKRIYDEEKSKCKCMAVFHEDGQGNCVGTEPDEESEEDVEEEPQQIPIRPVQTPKCKTGETEVDGKCMKCPSGATGKYPNCVCTGDYEEYDATQNKCVDDDVKKAQQEYDDAKAKEQSWANRGLTAVTTAATGIGGMQLAQGLAEQSADKKAESDMAAYIETMRCEYGNGVSVKPSKDTQIELPGGNDDKIMKYRTDYLALAGDLKERKAALGLKPGIESEEILEKADLGLYDDENVGITSGNYASLYRAQIQGSDADKEKLASASKEASTRVKAGAIAAGAGVVVGVVGDSLINGELGEKIKEIKDKNSNSTENEKTISLLMDKLKSAGVEGIDAFDTSKISKYDISLLYSEIQNRNFSGVSGENITHIFDTSNKTNFADSVMQLLNK